MRSRIVTNNVRNLRRNLPRFISLLVMSMLGVFVFVGLQATAPDMVNTLDQYLDEHHVYDLEIASNLGFGDEDMDAIREIEQVKDVEGVYWKDVLTFCGEEEQVIRVSSMTSSMNDLRLIEGKLPEEENEIVMEESFLRITGMELGDTLSMANAEYVITGTVESPHYYNSVSISQSRGTTDTGTGRISYYAYVKGNAFGLPRYNKCYVTLEGAEEELTSSDEYLKLVEDGKAAIDEMVHPSFMNMEPKWYVNDRTDYLTYSDYIDDSKSIANLSKIFPVVFFIVAVLVSLISMNRMVEDDRLEIGTLKSLGFSGTTIVRKYLSFSFFATAIGGILGVGLGCVIIPEMIYSIYQILFDLPPLVLSVPVKDVHVGLAIMLACVCGTSIFTAMGELREKPSVLMRPKAPKNGRRVFLERIPFIWQRLKFSRKVTIRNIFRYKKRVFATVFGIMGCTALMLIGFGIRDSVGEIAGEQFGGVFKYDATVYLGNNENLQEIFDLQEIKDYVAVQKLNVTHDDRNLNLVIVKDDSELSKMAELVDASTGKVLHLEPGKTIINDKLADQNNLKVGDTICLLNSEHQEYEFEVQAIFKNYLEHYAFIDSATFEEYEKWEPNQAVLFTDELTDKKEDAMIKNLLEREEILFATPTHTLVESANDMLNSLNKVVAILIVLAAMLAFVVLYNLSTINISERRREIATLKVLGFYDREVDQYITRENAILTIIGIILGLWVGKYLTHFVVITVEIERARFMNWIKVPSYVYSAVLSACFTFIVNSLTHFKLLKIDMIDSLKSVE